MDQSISFTQAEKLIVEAFQTGLFNDAFETTKALLDTGDLNNGQITEIMLSVFKAGKVNGKEILKRQIASLR